MLGLLGGVLGSAFGSKVGTGLVGKVLAGIGGAGGAAAGGAAVLGGLGDYLDGRRAQRDAYGREDTNIIRLVEQARQVGLNPLSVLGSNAASYQAPSPVLPQLGNVAAEGLREAGRAALSGPERRILDANARRAEADATLAEFQAANAGRAMIAPNLNARRNPIGGETLEPIPLMVPYRRQDGSIILGPNPDLPSNDQWFAPQAIEGINVLPDVGRKAPAAAPSSQPAAPMVVDPINDDFLQMRREAEKRAERRAERRREASERMEEFWQMSPM